MYRIDTVQMFWIDLGREGVVERSFLYTKGRTKVD